MQEDYKYLRYNGEDIVARIRSSNDLEHSAYFPHNVLIYVEKGTLKYRVKNQTYIVTKGNHVIVKKNIIGYYSKIWTEEEKEACIYAILLKNEILKNEILKKEVSKIRDTEEKVTPITDPIAVIPKLDSATKFFLDTKGKFDTNQPIDSFFLNRVKTIVSDLVTNDTRFLNFFRSISTPSRIALRNFIEHHFKMPYTVDQLASMAGMSLSTFYREFKEEFDETPHQWVKKRRLQLAYELLKTRQSTVSVVYHEVGFKDLAHFSKSFKKEYKINPSLVYGKK